MNTVNKSVLIYDKNYDVILVVTDVTVPVKGLYKCRLKNKSTELVGSSFSQYLQKFVMCHDWEVCNKGIGKDHMEIYGCGHITYNNLRKMYCAPRKTDFNAERVLCA